LPDEQPSAEPELVQQERVSFYELKNSDQFNYFPHCMVERVHVAPDERSAPNFGVVLNKQLDGSVLVRWLRGQDALTGRPVFRDESWLPWKLRQLASANSSYCMNGVSECLVGGGQGRF